MNPLYFNGKLWSEMREEVIKFPENARKISVNYAKLQRIKFKQTRGNRQKLREIYSRSP